MTQPALGGLKVVDLAWVVAAPLVGRALADFGATVVRIESAQRTDTARMMGPFPDAAFDNQQSLLWENCNANKLGLTLDLRRAEAREVVRDLVRWGDVLVESFTPGQMARFELDYPRLRAINPALVMLSSSLMGQTGPNAQLGGFGNIGGALSGFQQIVGQRGQLPVGPFGPYTDYVGPRFGLMALLAALDHRRRTGEGCYLDISQVEGAVAMLAPELLDFQANGRIVEPLGNRAADQAPSGIFRAAGDDCWVAIVARDDDDWNRLAAQIGGDALHPDFADLTGRKRHEDALESLVAEWTMSRNASAIEATLQAAGVPAHVVAGSAEILADNQLAHRDHIVRMPHPRMGETVFDAARYRMSDTPAAYRRAAPTFGRDNRHVLADILGYDDARIETLTVAGVLT